MYKKFIVNNIQKKALKMKSSGKYEGKEQIDEEHDNADNVSNDEDE